MNTGMLPRANHLQRVYQVKSGAKIGTAFLIDVDHRQYLVSALHVVEHSAETASLEISKDGQWQNTPISVVGIDMQNDIAVFALTERRIGAELPIRISGDGCVLGQEVFFLGYPLGLKGHLVEPGIPLPLVMRSVAASFHPDPRSIYLSGGAPPGFSGAPVYYAHSDSTPVLTAVLLEELAYSAPVVDAAMSKIGSIWLPSGLVRCSYIDHALRLISVNPIGLALV